MRFYTKQQKFYGGIDLHARTMVPLHLESGGDAGHARSPPVPDALHAPTRGVAHAYPQYA